MSPEDGVSMPNETVCWFHCFAGIAGDMALGSLLDAGADLGEVQALVSRVGISSWGLETETVTRAGISCTKAVVDVIADGTERPYKTIAALLDDAKLPERVRVRAHAVFSRLADVEGLIHGVSPEDVHFHEVGGHDAIVDVVGTAAALEVLGVDRLCASAVALGTGTTGASHGTLPNPSPAVVRLFDGVPAYGRPLPVELTTPTGAAILAALCTSFGPMPPMRIEASGYGAGAADIDGLPNCTQVVVGTVETEVPGPGQPLTVLEANLDDITGEQLGLAIERLISAGALDAWVTPIVMKKGRPAHTLHALCDPASVGILLEVFSVSAGTFGVRASSVERWAEARTVGSVRVAGHEVSIKAGRHRAKAEFDDVTRVAEETGVAPKEVGSLAEETWHQFHDGPGAPAVGEG